MNTQLPSQFAHEQKVLLNFNPLSGNEVKCLATIIAIHFTISKVRYDIEVDLIEGYSTRLYNIDSCFIKQIV